ncbi:hypothetical protein [Streptomyces goshikiensis]|uniref:hypothetical protein n=1 Tax=Streptomyces goshikiensis TaxID=1942 RepID=UPI003653649B
MDHRAITTTQGYYRIGAERRREAVDRATALQFDRHGNRVWRAAQSLLDSEHVRRAIGEVATPYGVCREPSNIAAGGHACPLRFRCLGRERLMSAFDADEWARTQAMPGSEGTPLTASAIARLEQRNVELTRALEERQTELDAARAANRDLTRALNQRG